MRWKRTAPLVACQRNGFPVWYLAPSASKVIGVDGVLCLKHCQQGASLQSGNRRNRLTVVRLSLYSFLARSASPWRSAGQRPLCRIVQTPTRNRFATSTPPHLWQRARVCDLRSETVVSCDCLQSWQYHGQIVWRCFCLDFRMFTRRLGTVYSVSRTTRMRLGAQACSPELHLSRANDSQPGRDRPDRRASCGLSGGASQAGMIALTANCANSTFSNWLARVTPLCPGARNYYRRLLDAAGVAGYYRVCGNLCH